MSASRLRAIARPPAARLCGGARELQAAGRHDVRQHLGRGDQLQGEHPGAASRAASVDGIRPERQVHPARSAPAVRPAARAADRRRRTTSGRPTSRRTWSTRSTRRADPAGARRARQCRRHAPIRPPAAVQRAERRGVRARGRCLRDPGARPRRAEGAQVRQRRQFHQGLGQEGQRAGRVRHRAFDRDRRQGPRLRRRPQQPAHPGVRRRRQLRARNRSIPARRAGSSSAPTSTSGWRTGTPAR